MGRLIDADVLIEAINKITCHFAEELWKRVVCDVISNQPTAYDIEKVDEQILEYYKTQIDKGRNGWDLVDDCSLVRKIVRKGGVE